MKRIRQALEKRMEAMGYFIHDRRYWVLVVMLLMMAALFSQLPKITVDTSNEGFLHESDPILKQYNDFRAQYGREEMIMLSIEAPDIFDLAFLQKLKQLHDELKANVPYLDDITSLINARNTRGEGDTLIVEDLLENWPQSAQELEAIKQRAMSSTTYRNFILSPDAKVTTVVIQTQAYSTAGQDDQDLMAGFEDTAAQTPAKSSGKPVFLTDAENSEAVAAVRQAVAKYQGPEFKVHMAGAPVVVDILKASMQKDMRMFTQLALLIIIVVLFFLFRRLSGVLLPLVVVILTVVSSISMMAATGVPIKLPTQILPSLLLAVGVAASVHLLAMFFQHFQTGEDKRAAIAHAMGHSGLAIVMTSLTTAAGLASFAASEVSPIAGLGQFASFGVLVSLLYSLVLMPALIAIFPIKHKGAQHETANHPLMDKFLEKLGHYSVVHAKTIVISGSVILVLALVSLLNIQFKHNPLTWMPTEWEVRQATEFVDARMGGSTTVEVVVNTGAENGLYEPDVMNKIQQLHQATEGMSYQHTQINKVASVLDILKESNRALNSNDEKFYSVPQERAVIAQELFLFENSGSDDLEDFVDSQFQQARITMKGPWVDAGTSAGLIRQIMQQVTQVLGEDVTAYVTGMGTLFTRTMDAAISSTRTSYLIAVVVICFMMILLLGDIKLGLVSMIPNLLPIMVALGVMAALNVPLDMFTMLVGSIAIGLAVDDTIHFMHNFRRYHQHHEDVDEAVRMTLHTTGRAIVVTTIVLCLGFFVFMVGDMNSVFRFGALVGSTILMALLADLLLAPALMQLMYGKAEKQAAQK